MTIREICEKYKISQSDLARRFGIPLRTVQGWYLGERKPPEYVVRTVAELLQSEVERRKIVEQTQYKAVQEAQRGRGPGRIQGAATYEKINK